MGLTRHCSTNSSTSTNFFFFLRFFFWPFLAVQPRSVTGDRVGEGGWRAAEGPGLQGLGMGVARAANRAKWCPIKPQIWHRCSWGYTEIIYLFARLPLVEMGTAPPSVPVVYMLRPVIRFSLQQVWSTLWMDIVRILSIPILLSILQHVILCKKNRLYKMLKDSTFFLLPHGSSKAPTEQKLCNYKYSWTHNQDQDQI